MIPTKNVGFRPFGAPEMCSVLASSNIHEDRKSAARGYVLVVEGGWLVYMSRHIT